MIRIFIAVILIITLIGTVHADTAQYYNETSGQMEVPIFTGTNAVSFCSLNNSDLDTIFAGLPPEPDDIIRRYINGSSNSAKFYAGYGWFEYTGENVNPIEAGVGYVYERQGGNCTWIYDTEFNCEEQKTLEELLMEFEETLLLIALLWLNHTSKKKNLLLVTASVTYTVYLTVYVNVNEHMALIGFYILILAYFVLSILPRGEK